MDPPGGSTTRPSVSSRSTFRCSRRRAISRTNGLAAASFSYYGVCISHGQAQVR